MSDAVVVLLRIPVADAVEWEPWLTELLSIQADEAGVGYDGGEEEGLFEVHEFYGTDAATVVAIAERVLAKRKVSRSIVARSGDQVEVSPVSGSVALVPLLAPGPYGTAVKKICRALEDDPAITSWLAVNHCSRFLFRQVPGDPEGYWEFERGSVDMAAGDIFAIAQVDLSIYEETRPSRSVVQTRARDNMRVILTRLGGYLQSPVPTTELLS